MSDVIAIGLVLIFMMPIILGVFGILSMVYDKVGDPIVTQLKLAKGLTLAQLRILEVNVPYYSRMTSSALKKQFEKRVMYFLMDKEFIPRHIPDITEEMRVMVGAAAAQVTFGFTPLRFPDFPTILIYPEEYLNRVTGKKHRGEINTKGVMVFSWADYMNGYRNATDGINLGLHEMAHALKIEDFTPNDEEGFLDTNAYQHWHRVANHEFNQMRAGNASFLRRYASTNIDEFWAVCIEQFFEQSQLFRQSRPELYDATARLLNQDPLQTDYKYRYTL